MRDFRKEIDNVFSIGDKIYYKDSALDLSNAFDAFLRENNSEDEFKKHFERVNNESCFEYIEDEHRGSILHSAANLINAISWSEAHDGGYNGANLNWMDSAWHYILDKKFDGSISIVFKEGSKLRDDFIVGDDYLLGKECVDACN